MPRAKNTFFCFSPPVMVATFLLEIALAAYVVWRYKLNPVTRLVALTLGFLAVFQAAEFMVCRGAPGHAMVWSRIGFVAITMLPPLGLHLAYMLAGVRRRWLVLPAYATAAGFILFFWVIGNKINGDACLGNYVIFQLKPHAGLYYGIYYYGWLLAVVGLCWYLAGRTKKRQVRRALFGLLAGYAAFILPTATVNILSPDTTRGIPSIMCGFAVLLALALAFVVVPATVKRQKVKRKRA